MNVMATPTVAAFTAGAAGEEYDDEEPLIIPATSNTIVVEAEDLELDERLREREDALYSSGCCAKYSLRRMI